MLTNTAIDKAKPKDVDFSLFDGDGLYLKIAKTGKKKWYVRLFMDGKERKPTIGEYPVMSLQSARWERDCLKLKARNGVAPSGLSKNFECAALEWLGVKNASCRPEHALCLKRRMELYLFPYFGKKTVSEINRREILEAINVLVERGTIETARRAATIVRGVLDYAVDRVEAESNVASDLARSLSGWEPVNFTSVYDPAEIGRLMRAIDRYERTVVRNALKMIAYTFVRCLELIKATWAEFREDICEWHIPAEHTKKRRDQVVPLSRQALAILEDMKGLAALRGVGALT